MSGFWRLARRLGFGLTAVAIAVYSLFPFYWAIVSSLKDGPDLYRVGFLPVSPTLTNYVAVFAEQPFARNILNSALVAGAAVAIALALAVPAAYALGRIEFRGRRTLLIGILAVSMFPQVAILSGLFELVRWLGLYDHLGALIISYLVFTLPFTVWILTTYMRELPPELEDAALLDGATPLDLLVRVLLPLLAPAAAATGLLAFIVAWNEFLFALTFTLSAEARTVPVAIALISGASHFELPWGRIMAASVIVTLPLIALTLMFQRRIVAGLTAGAVQG
jgi:trehalose/maltose transport system permease protein